jgi:hypothetical protein
VRTISLKASRPSLRKIRRCSWNAQSCVRAWGIYFSRRIRQTDYRLRYCSNINAYAVALLTRNGTLETETIVHDAFAIDIDQEHIVLQHISSSRFELYEKK